MYSQRNGLSASVKAVTLQTGVKDLLSTKPRAITADPFSNIAEVLV